MPETEWDYGLPFSFVTLQVVISYIDKGRYYFTIRMEYYDYYYA